MVAETDTIATMLGKSAFSEFSAVEQSQINKFIENTEAALQSPPYSFKLSADAFTEYLPITGSLDVSGSELLDFDVNESGQAVPIDQRITRTSISLTHKPVLADSLQVWEDRGAMGGQASGAFGAATLLTKGEDYYLDESSPGISMTGILHRSMGWSRTPRSIKVTYKAGPLAQQAASLGGEFLTVLRSVIHSSVIENFLFWAQQSQAFSAGNAGRVTRSESIGKWSESFGALGGFGTSAETLPEHHATRLSGYISMSQFLRR